ncbi:hypothetical protein EXIGLDRAFT_832668 [Exidia glandulosa HHB12029]|uniref:DUF6533 domain-containing protein n=1 Tax=Exidia glandulosa HHB12029 TaxID=1314781 RepID=A0A165LFU4_EXIGL|nr:hypothetical protein EXIGLDRAFT_832668 [Exidia glandulosa HHB12029]
MNLTAGTPTPSGYLQIACTAWYVYDWILTLDDEIEYIWRRRWSFAKGLFFLIRFTTFGLLIAETAQYIFLDNLSESQYVMRYRTKTAPQPLHTERWTGQLRFGLDSFGAEYSPSKSAVDYVIRKVVLQFRVWVMYEKSRRVLWVNGGLFLANISCAVVLVIVLYSQDHFVAVPLWIQGSCYDVRPAVLGTIWVAPLCYETHLTLMAVYKLARDYRLHGYLGGPSLLSTLVRDSVVYFVLIVIVMGLNVFFWGESKVTPGDSVANLIHAAGGIGGARIILSMMQAVLKPAISVGDTAVLSTRLEMRAMSDRRKRVGLDTSDSTLNGDSEVRRVYDGIMVISP